MGVKPVCGSTISDSSGAATVLAGVAGEVLVVEPTDDVVLVLCARGVVVRLLSFGDVVQAAVIIAIQTNITRKLSRLNVIDVPCNTSIHTILQHRVPTPNA